jgi:mRNA interferase RelE/StbE
VVAYRLLVKASAAKELATVPTKDRRRLIERIRALANEPRPHGSQKLSGRDKYRLRQGRYRVVYLIDDAAREVTIFKVGHRRDVYR